MQTLTEANGQFKNAVIGGQDDDIASRVQYRRADLAVIEVVLHGPPGLFGYSPIQIFGDVVPNMFAIYNHGSHLRFDFRVAVFNWGARHFCSIIRARCSRTLTLGMLRFKARAVSWTFSSSTSRRRKTSRYLS